MSSRSEYYSARESDMRTRKARAKTPRNLSPTAPLENYLPRYSNDWSTKARPPQSPPLVPPREDYSPRYSNRAIRPQPDYFPRPQTYNSPLTSTPNYFSRGSTNPLYYVSNHDCNYDSYLPQAWPPPTPGNPSSTTGHGPGREMKSSSKRKESGPGAPPMHDVKTRNGFYEDEQDFEKRKDKFIHVEYNPYSEWKWSKAKQKLARKRETTPKGEGVVDLDRAGRSLQSLLKNHKRVVWKVCDGSNLHHLVCHEFLFGAGDGSGREKYNDEQGCTENIYKLYFSLQAEEDSSRDRKEWKGTYDIGPKRPPASTT